MCIRDRGTGGALLFAKDILDEWFLMANGDSIFDFNYREFVKNTNGEFIAKLALREVPDPARFGAVTLKGEKIIGFMEKSETLKGPALINGGIYLISKDILELMNGPCSMESEIFPKIVAMGKLRGEQFNGYFLDMGLPLSLIHI